MVRSLQKKFTAAAMLAVTILLAVLVAGINLLNWASARRGQDLVLEELTERGAVPGRGALREGGGFFDRLFGGGLNSRESGFFLVYYDGEGEIVQIDESRIFTLEEGEAEEIAREVLSSGRTRGVSGDFRFLLAEKAEGDRESGTGPGGGGPADLRDRVPEDFSGTAAFLSIERDRAQTWSFLGISVFIALVCLVLMILPVRLLSALAIRPVAENMQRQKEFVTNAGHEIKTPLAIIQANTDALELRTGETKWTRNIREQTRRLSGLMQNLLTLSRMDETGLTMEKEVLDLPDLVREAWKPFSQSAENRGIVCVLDLPEKAAVRAGRQSLAQLLSILFDNAVRYTDEGGEILVRVSRDGGGVLLCQSNTCRPEDLPEEPERLFERFYRPDASRSREKGGSGIGLSAALAIARANDASLSVRREGEDRLSFALRFRA